MAKEYSTIQGDMWDGIAKKMMGRESYMNKLIEANPEQAQTVIFPANVKLTIPEVTTSSPLKLPPWKRGGTV